MYPNSGRKKPFQPGLIRCPGCGELHPPNFVRCPTTGMPLRKSSQEGGKRGIPGWVWGLGGLILGGIIIGVILIIGIKPTPPAISHMISPTSPLEIITKTISTPIQAPTLRSQDKLVPLATISTFTDFGSSVGQCPNALPSKLHIGNKAEVTYFQVKGRSAPGLDSPAEHTLADGRVVEVIDGPICADGFWWWKIYFAGTISTGQYLEYQVWMPEVDYDTYYLKPVN